MRTRNGDAYIKIAFRYSRNRRSPASASMAAPDQVSRWFVLVDQAGAQARASGGTWQAERLSAQH